MRKFGFFAVLGLMFLIIAAPGGGFGGGRGGGGFSGGGFRGGGGGFRSSGGFGRSSSYSRGRPADPRVVLPIILGLFGGFGLLAFWLSKSAAATMSSAATPIPMGLVNLVVSLRSGDEHARGLDELVRRSDFRTPAARLAVLRKIAARLEAKNIVDGFVAVTPPSSSGSAAAIGDAAEKLAREQMARVELKPETVNVAEGGRIVQQDGGGRSAAPARALMESQCVLGIMLTAQPGLTGRLASGGGVDAVVAALKTFAETTTPGKIDALYVYFAPAPGERLDADAAARMLSDLRR